MNEDNWRTKTAQRDRFLDPQNDVIAGAALVIPKIMVKTNLGNLAGGK
ncbi:hypothetical protein SAMN05880566_14410 [Janthinobacterium sp. TND4EL3]|nr:hypothetical protein SAMN05880566_14410 [Janthinobacterium sp. TND4EL3]